jgi:hypothetical protein
LHQQWVSLREISLQDQLIDLCRRLRNATKMIKVEVGGGKEGPPEAEWIIHENLLLANSGLVKSCLAHDTTETSTGTIKMEEADAEAFGVFADFLYKERLDSSKLDVKQLITCYILADYVACPKFADLIFQQIYIRTHKASFLYSAKQVGYILSNTLAVQPLRALLLDQVGRGILLGRYCFITNKGCEQLLEPHMADLLGAVVRAVNSTNVAVTSKPNQNIYPDIKHYLKHEIASVEVPGSQPQSATVDAWKDAEAEIGHQALDYLVREAGVSRGIALQTLKANGFRIAIALKALKRT